ncbi:MAG: gamma-glutamylcyclotransferase [Boseongicola sp.]|nr:gamma-glutamylcyclotransferase [Boseongicola sp.]
MSDPFVHHPELRALIADPEASMFRKQSMAEFIAFIEAAGLETDWFHSDAEREASRAAAIKGREEQDFWFFGYGSLMWDPGIRFVEVRRAYMPGYSRQFILKDTFGGRGTDETPGLMAALDHGEGCHGLAFRIAKEELETETDFIWRREFIAPGYHPEFATVETDHGSFEALTFLADHEAETMCADLTWEEKVRFAATGKGLFGTSLEYISNIIEHFETLGIDDADTKDLHTAALAYNEARKT